VCVCVCVCGKEKKVGVARKKGGWFLRVRESAGDAINDATAVVDTRYRTYVYVGTVATSTCPDRV
jgi:hypothetical protein